MVEEQYHNVRDTLTQVADENRFEKKANAGPSTQYLLLFADQERDRLTVDEVLSLYLVDVAERCKKSPPILPAGSPELQELMPSTPQKAANTGKSASKNKEKQAD